MTALIASDVLAVIVLVPAGCLCLTGVVLAALFDPKDGLRRRLRDRADRIAREGRA